MSKKTVLPSGSSYSKFTVSPANWLKAGASVAAPWRIYYRFYDNQGICRQIAIKGMNKATTLLERRQVTKDLIRTEQEDLHSGYNPITKKFATVDNALRDVDELTLVFDALRYAVPLQDCIPKTRTLIKQCVEVLAACGSGINHLPIGSIRPKHILLLLRTAADRRNMTASNYNHYRAYVMMLFRTLVPMGCIDINPVRDIPKKKMVKTKKKTLNDVQRAQVKQLLSQPKHANFYRYVQMFFASGARSTELLTVKIKDIDLPNQRYSCIIRKGRQWEEVYKTITDDVLALWRHQVSLSTSAEDYLFGRYLLPQSKPTTSAQITRRWHKLIKSNKTGLGIACDFYSLKFLRTTEIVDLIGTGAAANLNSHKSEAMVRLIYDVGSVEREHRKLRTINKPF